MLYPFYLLYLHIVLRPEHTDDTVTFDYRCLLMIIPRLHFSVLTALFAFMQNMEATTACVFQGLSNSPPLYFSH